MGPGALGAAVAAGVRMSRRSGEVTAGAEDAIVSYMAFEQFISVGAALCCLFVYMLKKLRSYEEHSGRAMS